MKKLRVLSLIVLVSVTIGFLCFIYLSNPIVLNGNNSTYEDKNGYHDIVFDIYNQGISKVLIKEVLINEQDSSTKVDLGISYDTLQYVQSESDNKLIIFVALDEAYVNLKIPSDQVVDVINKREMTPIHYGIRIKNYKDPIKTITIKYKYLGLPVSKVINVNNES